MRIPTKYDYLKQTASLLLCGLLPCLCIAQQRSFSDATKIANTFVLDHPRMSGMSDVRLKLASSIISPSNELRADKEAYYIFTSESDEIGFVIVSGDKRMPEILAYSDNNRFDTGNMPPSVRYWLDCYVEEFLSLNGDETSDAKQLSSVNPSGVAPLLGNIVWGQGDPYNRNCPTVRSERCVTGCVATAMAQVMKFHKYPNSGKGSVNYYTDTNNIHLQKDFSMVQFHWDNMLDKYKMKFSLEEADAVAELMYACGTSVKMDYCTEGQGGSGAYQNDLIPAFVENFSYDDDAAFMARSHCSIEDWHNILVNELNAGRPVNYAGSSTRDGGHSFVLDGYRVGEGNAYPDYHVNWGWNGNCDGYYKIADLHPSEDGQHATYSGFNNSQQMTIGIKPEDGIDEGVVYLCTPNLYVSTSTAKAGSNLKVYTASCANCSYKPFNGTLSVALISVDDDSETILGEYRMKALSYLQEQNNISIDVSLPSSLPNGQYTIQLRSKPSGKSDYQQVISKQYSQLTISSTDSVTPDVASEAMLGCSELEVVSDTKPSLVSLNIYELQNLQESPFIGDLRMILADKSGKQLCAFGDSIQPGELSTFEIQEAPLKIHGQLVGEWPDGDYKVYVGARQINTSRYVYLSFYDISQPDIEYHELSLSAQIKGGKLIINGKTYDISPTSINQVEQNDMKSKEDTIRIYRLDGLIIGSRVVNTLPSGVYVIRQGKLTRKMIIR